MIDGAASLARRIRAGDLSARDAVDTCLAAIDAVNGELNAVVQLVPERARAEAQAADERHAAGEDLGPLHGVPVTIKDCFATEGIVTTVGTTGLRSFVPAADDVTVTRLRDAGAIVVAKTNCPEFLMGLESDNLVYGRTVNPFDVTRTCGGSSGGEAAIIAAGASPLGLGSDSGGSLRVPAHFCGVPTLKPTHGRVPITSAVFPSTGPFSRLRGVGTLAPTVEDVALALGILAGPDGRDPWAAPVPMPDPSAVDVRGLRIALYTQDGVSSPTPETVAAVEGAGLALEKTGAHVDDARLPAAEEAVEIFTGILGGDGGAGPADRQDARHRQLQRAARVAVRRHPGPVGPLPSGSDDVPRPLRRRAVTGRRRPCPPPRHDLPAHRRVRLRQHPQPHRLAGRRRPGRNVARRLAHRRADRVRSVARGPGAGCRSGAGGGARAVPRTYDQRVSPLVDRAPDGRVAEGASALGLVSRRRSRRQTLDLGRTWPRGYEGLRTPAVAWSDCNCDSPHAPRCTAEVSNGRSEGCRLAHR
jgi:Asp-tRNA(Asn)/Glu-tRNA(Gln) amidotransferase A subunit family amidase